MKEWSLENNPSNIDEVYETLDEKGRLAVDSARQLAKQFLEKNDIKGLKEQLESLEEWKNGFSDKSLRKEVGKLLSAEIKRQFQEKKEVAQEKGKVKKPGSVAQIFEASQRKHEELEKMLKKDRDSAVIARQELDNVYESELSQEQREILEGVGKRGRSLVYTSVSIKFGPSRGVTSGFQPIIDKKEAGSDSNDLLKRLNKLASLTNEGVGKLSGRYTGRFFTMMAEADITAAITIMPLTEKTPTYETVEETKGVWPFRKTEKVDRQTGIHEKQIAIGELNGNNEDDEEAYTIVYFVKGTDKNGYLEPDGNRMGNMFSADIILPKSVAQKAFLQIQKNPEFAKEILKKLDPELMQIQEDIMPKAKKVFILPEEVPAEVAFDGDTNNYSSIQFKKDSPYIKTIK